MRSTILSVLTVCISLLVGAVLAEAGFRLYVYFERPERFEAVTERPESYPVFHRSLWEFDEQHGYRYRSEFDIYLTSIRSGRVESCTVADYINENGNVGAPMNDHADPDLTIAVFGDSWTAFIKDGLTWPHVLRRRLQEETGLKINLYNFGRDGTGLIHMFRMAEEMIPKAEPDLAIVAFITDDLDRAMFWRTEAEIDGRLRALTTTVPEPTPPLDKSTDTVLVDPRATRAWCLEAKGEDDPLTAELEARQEELLEHARASTTSVATLWTVDYSFIQSHIENGDALFPQRPTYRASTNPRLDAWSYYRVEGFAESVEKVRSYGVPFHMVHLPIYPELKQGEEYLLTPQNRELLKTLQAITAPAYEITDYMAIPTDLARINSAPDNYHPSVYGMEFYAEGVAKILQRNDLLPAPGGSE